MLRVRAAKRASAAAFWKVSEQRRLFVSLAFCQSGGNVRRTGGGGCRRCCCKTRRRAGVLHLRLAAGAFLLFSSTTPFCHGV